MLQKKAHESYWNTSEEEKNTKASISWNKKRKKIPNMFVNNRNLSEEEKAEFFLVITKEIIQRQWCWNIINSFWAWKKRFL